MMKRKPKWWNIDWVELGCRGWDIRVIGAGLGEDGELDWQYAHLDRDTLDLLLSGRPAFVVRVLGDLVAAGLFRIVEETYTWNVNMDVGGVYDTKYLNTSDTTAGSGYQLRLVV
jgi:hypothetical protein